MTYNIRLGIQQGVEAIAEIIAAQNPDIIALQEVGNDWRMGPGGDTASRVCEMLGIEHHCYVTTIVEDERHRYGHALLSRWPIEDREIFRFTQKIDEPRAALVAHINTDEGPLRVISTHLSHRDKERSVHGTELVELVGTATTDGKPTLLMGDLNEVDNADWIHALKDRMDDAGDLVDGGSYPNPEPLVRIDYLMLYRGRIHDAEILDEPEASDHRPLVATIELSLPDS